MTEQALRKMIAAGESTRQEFKSWVKCKDYRQRKDLCGEKCGCAGKYKGRRSAVWRRKMTASLRAAPRATRRH